MMPMVPEMAPLYSLDQDNWNENYMTFLLYDAIGVNISSTWGH